MFMGYFFLWGQRVLVLMVQVSQLGEETKDRENVRQDQPAKLRASVSHIG